MKMNEERLSDRRAVRYATFINDSMPLQLHRILSPFQGLIGFYAFSGGLRPRLCAAG
jgi:hypothetical protein